MDKIELEIVGLSHSITHSSSYAVVLGEVNGVRRLPIVIGSFEAQAIAVAMENITPARPLTHDLVKNMLDKLEVTLSEVIINDLKEGIFYALLVCKIGDKSFEIDSRTSDAIALAVRFKCPIYTYDFILESAGITIEDSELDKEEDESIGEPPEELIEKIARPGKVQGKSLEELNKMLNEALEQEDYEQAARIRDEIKRKSEN